MNKQWQDYGDKYLAITPREQYMVLITGLVAIIFIIHTFFIDDNSSKIDKFEKQIIQMSKANRSANSSITLLEDGLSKDPNSELNKQISQYKERLKKVDVNLLQLTSDLINPIQMRHALLQLLKTQKGISLQSFQVIPAQAITLASSKPAVKIKDISTAETTLTKKN